MPMSNFPSGFPNGVAIRGVPIVIANPGRVFWVSSTADANGIAGSNGYDGTYRTPFSTIVYAMSQCSANLGDIIMVKPGHTETVSSSSAMTWDKAGVAIVGLGVGSNRPKITIDTANTATINVTAANISLTNFQVFGNFLSIAAAFTLTTAKYFTLQNVYVSDTSGILNFLNVVKSTGAANTVDGLYMDGCVWNSLGTTSVNSTILTANDIDNLTFTNNQITMLTTVDQAAGVVVTAGVLTNAMIAGNYAYRKNTTTANSSLVNVGGTTSTGYVANNRVQTLTTSADKLFTTTVGLAAFENRVTGVVGATGFVIPAVDS